MVRRDLTTTTSRKRPRAICNFHESALLILCSWLCLAVDSQETTCSLGGQIFQAGQPLGDQFTTRCGSASDFPCFCKPEASPPVDCPYCGIATQENEAGIVCARVEGPSVTVFALDGEVQDCTCQRDLNGNPESICVAAGEDNNPTSPTSAPAPSPAADDDVCTLEWDDGSTDVYQDGESYGELFSTRCGPPSEYPCYCNVSIPEKLYCPYCGVTSSTGDLTCGRIGQTFVLTDESNEEVSCSCGGDLEADCIPLSSITPSPTDADPTLQPTLRPSILEGTLIPVAAPTATTTPTPVIEPTLSPFSVPFPTKAPVPAPTAVPTKKPTLTPTVQEPTTRTPSAPTPTVDKPSILMPSRTPPVTVPIPGCDYFDENAGQDGFVATGEELGSTVIDGPCSPSGSFPVLCNPALPGGVEYPYCVFTTDGEWSSSINIEGDENNAEMTRANTGDDLVVCAKNGDQVTVPTSTGTIETCTCLYLNPFIGPVSSCAEFLVSVPLALTPSPSAAPSPAPTTPFPTGEPTRTFVPMEDNESSVGLGVSASQCARPRMIVLSCLAMILAFC